MQTIDDWIDSRPEPVRQLLTLRKPGSVLLVGDRTLYIIGATEDGMYVVSSVSPYKDYHASLAAKEYVCAMHLR